MHSRRPAIALLIDALGTLVALEPPAPRLAHALGISEAQAARALAAEIAYYRAHMDEGRDAGSVADLRARCAAVLGAALADPPAHGLTDALLHALRFTAHPDARPALIRARRAGARVVVVSNWDVSLVDVLERVGLAPLLHGVVTSAAVGARKPAPEIFAHALALAGVPADRALHVGDTPDDDVAGARACGIRAVLLRRDARDARAEPPGADGAVIAGLDELRWP